MANEMQTFGILLNNAMGSSNKKSKAYNASILQKHYRMRQGIGQQIRRCQPGSRAIMDNTKHSIENVLISTPMRSWATCDQPTTRLGSSRRHALHHQLCMFIEESMMIMSCSPMPPLS